MSENKQLKTCSKMMRKKQEKLSQQMNSPMYQTASISSTIKSLPRDTCRAPKIRRCEKTISGPDPVHGDPRTSAVAVNVSPPAGLCLYRTHLLHDWSLIWHVRLRVPSGLLACFRAAWKISTIWWFGAVAKNITLGRFISPSRSSAVGC